MAIDYVRNIISSGYNLAKINDNFAKIETALQDAVSRSGNGPNQMEADFDMNSNDILNVGSLETDILIVDGVPVQAVGLADALKTSNALSEFIALGTQATAVTNLGLNPFLDKVNKAYARENHVLNYNADTTGVTNTSAAFNSAQADGRQIRAGKGTYKLDTNYNMGIGTYLFDRGAGVISPDGSQGRALLNGLGTWDWFDGYISQPDRAILRAPGFTFKADNFVDDSKTDHGSQTDIFWYNRPSPIAAVGGVQHRRYMQYGSVATNTQGSVIGSETEWQIYNASKTGRTFANELNIDAKWTICQPVTAGLQQGLASYMDLGYANSPNDEMVFSAVLTAAFRNHSNFNTLRNSGPGDLGHFGNYGINIVTNPQIGAFGAPQLTTRPAQSMLLISGYSGAPSIFNGITAGATPAAEYAVLIGRHGGQWTNGVTTRSKFNEGLRVEDWVNAAIRIRNMHPDGTGLGIDNPFNTELGGNSAAFNNISLYVKSNDAASSTTARLRIGDWVLEQSPDNAGIKNFAIRDLNNSIRYFMGTDGAFYPNADSTQNNGGLTNHWNVTFTQFLKLRSLPFASLPAANTALGRVAYVNNLTARTRDTVAAGGGSNQMLVFSDGINWLIL